jgi:ABC-type transport system substrate-binding protein/DNA-binding SARP family transcriptional activator
LSQSPLGLGARRLLQDTSAEATVSGDRIEFRILGPLEVRVGDAPLRIGGPRQRALLAFLLLSANQAVSRDRLIDELFGDARPASAGHALRVQVSRLRKALDGVGGERLLASSPGYLLRVEPGELDLQVFEQLFAEGRRAMEEGEADHAAAKLHAAEKLWRGRPLADLEFEPFARVEVERLEELRLGAAEARIEAELALGRQAALVPELEALVGEHPLRERLRSQLMLALYRCGRQADALETYRVGRSLLSRELALEPSRLLRELEHAILRQEPALELAANERRVVATKSAPALRARPREKGVSDDSASVRPRRWRRYVVPGALALAVPAAVMAFVAARVTSHAPTVVAAANSVGIIDPGGDAVRAVVDLGGRPRGIASGAGATWVTDGTNDLLLQIDRKGVVERIPVGHGPTGVAVGDGEVWVVNQLDRTVFELNPRAFRRVATFRVGNGADAIAFGRGSLWVANTSDGTISRIDPATGAAVTIPLAGTPTGVALGGDGVWVTTSAGQLLLVDGASNRVTRAISIGNGPAGVAVGGGGVWVTNPPDASVSRVDPGSGSVTKINVGGAPVGIAYGSDAVWVANSRDGAVDRVDPNGNAVRSIHVGNEPIAVAAGSAGVGTTVLPATNGHRGGTLRVVESPAFGVGPSVDPAVFGGLGQWQMLSLTNDGLVAYRRIGGIAGSTLVPDLASELPSPTGDGRIYTFHLRRGIRYSDGTPVRPEDFRRAIERVFRVGNGYTQSPFTGIVGARQCAKAPRTCTLHHGILTDDRGNTITFRLTAPDPDFLYKLAFPMAAAVPAKAPSRDIGRRPLPATGPYMTESVALTRRPLDREHGRGIRSWTLVRNPRFHEWSADAQPSGYPARIVLSANAKGTPQAASAIEHGVDVLVSPTTRELPQLRRRYASQLHSNPIAATFAFVMNTRVAPFDRLAVRRALNYAIDRKRILALAGGSLEAQPTCQILPPTLAGYQPYCPYTLQPNASGAWTAPDLAKAERLVRGSGRRNARVTVLVPPPDAVFPTTKLGRYIVAVLRRLGFHASLRKLSWPMFERAFGDSRAQPQIGWFTWYQDYPAPSNFIDPLLSCRSFTPRDPANLNLAEFCEPKIDSESRHAAALEARTPGIAADEWRRIDRQLTDRATWLPLYNPRVPVALSRRVGNYEYHPFWQLLLDQLWVR